MSEESFVHLHVHSHYSMLDGTCKIPDLVARAKEFGMTHLALTDHGNLFGAVEFFSACRKEGITPIIGMEAYLAPGSRFERKKGAKPGSWPHLVLLAQNEKGYRNLVRIASSSYLEGFYYKPRTDKELLSQSSEGLIGMSGCLQGEINRAVLEGNEEQARALIGEYQEIFGKENFFLEIMRHGLPEQEALNKRLPGLSEQTGAPLVSTCDVHYLDFEDAHAQDVHLCLSTRNGLEDKNRLRMDSDKFYFRSPAEMRRLFSDLPEAVLNTRRIAERIEFEFNFAEKCLPSFKQKGVSDNARFFTDLCREGLRKCYGSPPDAVKERLETEIKVIKRMGFVDYFLIVWDLIRYARENSIPVGPGRGSAAGSLVAYCLEITQLDPLKYGLIFERFLNEERVSMPDIDIDFCMAKRGEMIEYVKRKYGEDHVSQIITFNRMAARAALRDVGRVLRIPLPEVDSICKKVPDTPGITLEEALSEEPDLKAFEDKDPRYKELFKTARKLEGVNRSCGTHAAGIVIGDRPLSGFVPLYKAGDTVSTQYAMEHLEKLGLLKMDFLGLRTLTIIDHARRMVEENHGVTVKFDNSELTDPKTYQLLQSGETLAVFQLESSGMRELVRQVAPDRFEDLIALLALFRPGPLDSGMVETYVNRKYGREKVAYPHPSCREILEETNGVILYQEQVMKIANLLGGFSLNEADNLRKAMGKKKADLMAKFRKKFVEGAAKNNVEERCASSIFDLMEKFAKYGFNKSHSAAYALLSYQTAYFKANWPAEFMAAVLSSEISNTDKIAVYLDECRRMNIPIRPPDVNTSQDKFTAVNGEIIYALSAVKNIGEATVRDIVARRSKLKGKSFTSFYGFCEELGSEILNKTILENLAKAGAFDSIEPDRARIFAAVEKGLARGTARTRERATGQLTFDDLLAQRGGEKPPEAPLPESPPWSEFEKLAFEKEVLGLYLTGHPLNDHRDLLQTLGASRLSDIGELSSGSQVVVAGQIGGLKPINTRKGERMAFLSLEDLSGKGEVVLFPELYRKCKEMLENEPIVFIKGKVDARGDSKSLIADNVMPVAQAPEKLTRTVTIRLDVDKTTEKFLFLLKRILSDHPGSCPVRMLFRKKENENGFNIARRLSVKPDNSFLSEVKKAAGNGAVRLETSADKVA